MARQKQPQPTPFPAINQLLQHLREQISQLLGRQFVAFYLHGSLANGDFNPQRSDIDFLVVTGSPLSPALVQRARQMHAHIFSSGMAWAARLEGPYIPIPALRRYQPQDATHPALRMDGTFELDHHATDWIIQRHLIRQQGIVLHGPPPHTLIDPVTPDQLRQAQIGILRHWWQPQLQDNSLLQSSEYQAYAILTMCRALYTLQHGAVATKSAAARWASHLPGQPYTPLIEKAVAWSHGQPLDCLPEVLSFIRYTLEQC